MVLDPEPYVASPTDSSDGDDPSPLAHAQDPPRGQHGLRSHVGTLRIPHLQAKAGPSGLVVSDSCESGQANADSW
eukprot:4216427-Pyramimonas_sp.AAC.1